MQGRPPTQGSELSRSGEKLSVLAGELSPLRRLSRAEMISGSDRQQRHEAAPVSGPPGLERAVITSGSFMNMRAIAGEPAGIKGPPACGRSLRDP